MLFIAALQKKTEGSRSRLSATAIIQIHATFHFRAGPLPSSLECKQDDLSSAWKRSHRPSLHNVGNVQQLNMDPPKFLSLFLITWSSFSFIEKNSCWSTCVQLEGIQDKGQWRAEALCIPKGSASLQQWSSLTSNSSNRKFSVFSFVLIMLRYFIYFRFIWSLKKNALY